MWQWFARGNIQQISYIPLMKQYLPFGLILLHLGNITTKQSTEMVETFHTCPDILKYMTVAYRLYHRPVEQYKPTAIFPMHELHMYTNLATDWLPINYCLATPFY